MSRLFILDGRNNQGQLLGIDSLNLIDIGLSNYLLGFRARNRDHVLKNIVYFELLRKEFDVLIVKIFNLEVDFIATNANEKLYIQVTETMKNYYKKIVITLDKAMDDEYDGIEAIDVIDVIEWLLK